MKDVSATIFLGNEGMVVQGNQVLLESRYEYQFQKQVR